MEKEEPLNWGEIFFILHKHCHLNKWQIWEYTLPQIVELMKESNKYIQFEITSRQVGSLGLLGGLGSSQNSSTSSETLSGDDDYKEITEEDVNELARVLGG